MDKSISTMSNDLKLIFGDEVSVFAKDERRNIKIETALEGKKLIAVIFGAEWCPFSRPFIATMRRFYNVYQTNPACKPFANLFEAIFASADISMDSFNNYTRDMPWLVLPQSDQKPCTSITIAEKVADYFEATHFPTLLILDARNYKVLLDSTSYMENFGDAKQHEEVDACVDLLDRWEGVLRRA